LLAPPSGAIICAGSAGGGFGGAAFFVVPGHRERYSCDGRAGKGILPIGNFFAVVGILANNKRLALRLAIGVRQKVTG
jgi:hypothetical protein